MAEQQDWPALIDLSEQALAVDPFDVGMRRKLALALEKLGRAEAPRQLDLLQRLDQSREVDYRLRRIDFRLARGQNGEAKKEVLELLEQVPHSWEAQQRLLRISEQR